MKFMLILGTNEPFDASTGSDKVPGASWQKVTKGRGMFACSAMLPSTVRVPEGPVVI
jgi:hypothetical protein